MGPIVCGVGKTSAGKRLNNLEIERLCEVIFNLNHELVYLDFVLG